MRNEVIASLRRQEIGDGEDVVAEVLRNYILPCCALSTCSIRRPGI